MIDQVGKMIPLIELSS